MPSLYLLDTNILVHLVRRDRRGQEINASYRLLVVEPTPLVSIVTDGELRSLAYQFGWGEQLVGRAMFLLDFFVRYPIDAPEILHTYAVIDADSRRRGVRMGKNDLWIAATAHVTGATLLTTDEDFDHLDPAFLTCERIV
jgi:tRNA(fMet)-specific endonuclease VapC